MQGVSTRSVADLVKAMGMTGISKSQLSRLCAEIDERVKPFPERPIEGSWPYLVVRRPRREGAQERQDDLRCRDNRCGGERRRPARDVGNGGWRSEAEPFWTTFLRSLTALFEFCLPIPAMAPGLTRSNAGRNRRRNDLMRPSHG